MAKKKSVTIESSDISSIPTQKPLKGRKPRGGKLISKTTSIQNTDLTIGNIILHLKCSLNDLEEYNENYNKQLSDPLLYNPIIPPEIQTYDTNISELHYNYIEDNVDKYAYSEKPTFTTSYINKESKTKDNNSEITIECKKLEKVNNDIEEETETETETDILTINQKLKILKTQLIKNNIHDKKSACFWCSYDFDNQECYIPSYDIEGSTYGYGSFCRPECAVAYLMKETIDDTTKFERYNLINQIYGKIYNYKKNIKPAPNPYYLLDKYYGNLSIEEYRKLLKSNHLLMIVEKPLTRIFPELHEDPDDFSVSNSCHSKPFSTVNSISGLNLNNGSNGETQYKVKKSNDNKNTKTKTSIIQEHFGIVKNSH